jgi:LPS sulfotransferase NodH
MKFRIPRFLRLPVRLGVKAASLAWRRARSLFRRERTGIVNRNSPFGFYMDFAVPVGPDAIFIYGWALDRNGKVEWMSVEAPGRWTTDNVLPDLHLFVRKDVVKFFEDLPGFAERVKEPFAFSGIVQREGIGAQCCRMCVSVKSPSLGRKRFVLRIGPANLASVATHVTSILPDPAQVDQLENYVQDKVFPLLSSLRSAFRTGNGLMSETAVYDSVPDRPRASIIVSGLREYAGAETHMMALAETDGIEDCEVIYVAESQAFCVEEMKLLLELYGLRARILVPRAEMWRADMLNLGASRAAGRLLCFLDLDVIPRSRHWFSRMELFHSSLSNAGAVGVKLLSPEKKIVHAGLEFEKVKTHWSQEAWKPTIRFLGLDENDPVADVTCQVPALSSMCMVVEKSLFERTGGFDGACFTDEYEDGTFCTELRRAGCRNWYLSDVTGYLVGHRNKGLGTNQMLCSYDAWLQSGKIREALLTAASTATDIRIKEAPASKGEIPLQTRRKRGRRMCRSPFFIFFQERSGSTWLVGLLNSHSDIRCLKEVFHLPSGNRQRGRFPDAATTRSMLEDIYRSRPGVHAAGFKYKYPSQYHHYPDVYDYLLEHADRIKMVLLYRRDRLRAAISMQNHERLKSRGLGSNLTVETAVNLGKIELDIDVAFRRISAREQADRLYSAELEKFPQHHVLAYEDLYGKTDEELTALCTFLGVGLGSNLSAPLVKTTEDRIEDAVSNYKELVERIRGTEYEKYLDMDTSVADEAGGFDHAAFLAS